MQKFRAPIPLKAKHYYFSDQLDAISDGEEKRALWLNPKLIYSGYRSHRFDPGILKRWTHGISKFLLISVNFTKKNWSKFSDEFPYLVNENPASFPTYWKLSKKFDRPGQPLRFGR